MFGSWIGSRVGGTPYDGMRVAGWPVGIFARGHQAEWDGAPVAPGEGEAVRFG